MSLPPLLQLSLQNELAQAPIQKLQSAYSKLSDQYRINRNLIHFSLQNTEQRISYLAARMPATYEAVYHVLNEIELENENELNSLLDVGAGPGTASWACSERFPSIQKLTLIEQNKEMAELGKKLSQNHPLLKNADWKIADFTKNIEKIEPADLVIASYSFNEIGEKNQQQFLKFVWEKTKKYLVLIDPGTPQAFHAIHKARQWFIENNASILSPCPHMLTCPAFQNEDWCHFSARVQRSSLHKMLKEGEKGYEDEKFSYLILTKGQIANYEGRIVRNPDINSGHLKLHLCTKKGFESITYSKKQGLLYKRARKSSWGDRWVISPSQDELSD
ncbi:small ribosomal subunit Rsm22 family protein [Silvanigrella aquatica]|uniref:Ribosomal small subunit Rsm22 n=1 Tax=Silvanigrella aquatica TaxID=1915309 RepID=A0A1L4CXN3_9BACT|nr:small ribosomal subunit Rsm22 family protein [Silvanigrella aquatica]APJ02705.1 hypothetical protein AXG55_01665 [Silvanigrella aquatica]